ncbi:hypothetical protein OSB04_un001349 [Centaurea solstitialis]|uniref:Uncharacterized protein n=1 Tax=Centaurea solstitialis TaxID=347529 RepID=A0AA38SGA4_9ASTR|nr:hypothetical protein OSB04_un001349 [Centaurea solstitialis]
MRSGGMGHRRALIRWGRAREAVSSAKYIKKTHTKLQNSPFHIGMYRGEFIMWTVKVLYGFGLDTMNACHIIVHMNCCIPSTSCTFKDSPP